MSYCQGCATRDQHVDVLEAERDSLRARVLQMHAANSELLHEAEGLRAQLDALRGRGVLDVVDKLEAEIKALRDENRVLAEKEFATALSLSGQINDLRAHPHACDECRARDEELCVLRAETHDWTRLTRERDSLRASVEALQQLAHENNAKWSEATRTCDSLRAQLAAAERVPPDAELDRLVARIRFALKNDPGAPYPLDGYQLCDAINALRRRVAAVKADYYQARLDYLEECNRNAPGWGAAVGAREEECRALRHNLAAIAKDPQDA